MKHAIQSIRMLIFMTILTGFVYPLIVTVFGQGLFRSKSSGDVVKRSGAIVGSRLLAQGFEGEKFFWPRPSAVSYNSLASGGSNLGQASADLKRAYDERRAKLKAAHAGAGEPPQDLLFASGSGLDPHISPEAAEYQVLRVAKARNMDPTDVRRFIMDAIEGRQLGFLGEPRVNVLALNIALDRAQGITAAPSSGPISAPSPTGGVEAK